ncbi:MAG: hypothetical protein HY709_11395 [Candidatus Latescibacteria bacterium]|nr:hypothetical protein [Candidatus Latescibacterota bacterium]
MVSQAILSLLIGGLIVSVLHAILPNHWLPFVLAGRAQRWSHAKTLAIALIAGGGHVMLTTLLGGILMWVGTGIFAYFEVVSTPVVGGLLTIVGVFYVVSYFRHRGHGHTHHHALSDKMAVLSLITMLTFSPCEAFLPIYLSAAPYGWGAFVLLSCILAVGTLGGILILVSLTFKGMERFAFPFVERYEGLILGLILVLLGGSVTFLH